MPSWGKKGRPQGTSSTLDGSWELITREYIIGCFGLSTLDAFQTTEGDETTHIHVAFTELLFGGKEGQVHDENMFQRSSQDN